MKSVNIKTLTIVGDQVPIEARQLILQDVREALQSFIPELEITATIKNTATHKYPYAAQDVSPIATIEWAALRDKRLFPTIFTNPRILLATICMSSYQVVNSDYGIADDVPLFVIILIEVGCLHIGLCLDPELKGRVLVIPYPAAHPYLAGKIADCMTGIHLNIPKSKVGNIPYLLTKYNYMVSLIK